MPAQCAGRGPRKGIALVAAGEAVEDQESDLDDEARVWHEFADLIRWSPSGKYLADRGQGGDLSHCLQLSIYDMLPVIRDGRITAWSP